MTSLALSACATTGAPNGSQLAELQAAVHSLRDENVRLEQRLARLEARSAIEAAAAKGTGAPSRAAAQPGAEPATVDSAVPQLTVVKLKPKREPAPRLPTAVEIVEPAPDAVEAIAPREAEAEDDPSIGDALFDQGVSSLKTGNVNGGVELLQKLAAESPRHAKADNALYFSGLGLMGLSEYERAARSFEEVLARYPAGDAVLDSMLKLAECRLKLNRPAEARAVYQRIVANYPGTAAATAAQTRLPSLR
jgi:TolA-binding protein